MILSLLKERANQSNKEWQSFQADIKSALDKILERSKMSRDDQSMFRERVSVLCDDYSMAINTLDIELIIKCQTSIGLNPSGNEETTSSSKEHACDGCSKTYSTSKQLRRHVREVCTADVTSTVVVNAQCARKPSKAATP